MPIANVSINNGYVCARGGAAVLAGGRQPLVHGRSLRLQRGTLSTTRPAFINSSARPAADTKDTAPHLPGHERLPAAQRRQGAAVGGVCALVCRAQRRLRSHSLEQQHGAESARAALPVGAAALQQLPLPGAAGRLR